MDDIARKKMAHVIAIGIGSPKGEKDDKSEGTEEPAGPDEGLVAAMEEFLAATAKKDAKGMAEAFESAHAIACAKSEDAYADEPDEA